MQERKKIKIKCDFLTDHHISEFNNNTIIDYLLDNNNNLSIPQLNLFQRKEKTNRKILLKNTIKNLIYRDSIFVNDNTKKIRAFSACQFDFSRKEILMEKKSV